MLLLLLLLLLIEDPILPTRLTDVLDSFGEYDGDLRVLIASFIPNSPSGPALDDEAICLLMVTTSLIHKKSQFWLSTPPLLLPFKLLIPAIAESNTALRERVARIYR